MDIKVYEKGSEEREKLRRMAHILTGLSPRGFNYLVGDTYFDFGQDWMWTTILCDGNDWGRYQALTPANQEKVLQSDVSDFPRIAQEILSGMFCPDRA